MMFDKLKQNTSHLLWPTIILFVGVALSSMAGYFMFVNDKERAATEFNIHVNDASSLIKNRTEVYFAILRTTGSFFAALDNNITHDEWKRYVAASMVSKNYPGIEGLGVIRQLYSDQKTKNKLTIRPDGQRSVYYPVEYFWPEMININLIGLDHGAYPDGVRALIQARNTGEITISKELSYAKGHPSTNGPVLFLYPVYVKGMPVNTESERQKALWGFVYARINLSKLFDDVITPSILRELYLTVYDVSQNSPPETAPIIYASDSYNSLQHSQHYNTEKVKIDGSTWVFKTESRPSSGSEYRTTRSLIVTFIGIFISICVSGFVFVRSQRNVETYRHAYFDSLTELPNRRLLENRLTQALANANRTNTNAALMFLDLDHFKPINDTLGHKAGDDVLKLISKRVLSCLREGDTLARVGGDEFVVLLLNITNKNDVCMVAQKVVDTISEPFQIGDSDMQVGSSIGIAMFPRDGTDHDALLKNADDAMYEAKRLGRNNFQFAKL